MHASFIFGDLGRRRGGSVPRVMACMGGKWQFWDMTGGGGGWFVDALLALNGQEEHSMGYSLVCGNAHYLQRRK